MSKRSIIPYVRTATRGILKAITGTDISSSKRALDTVLYGPDGEASAIHNNHFKTIGYKEAIGDGATNTNITIERCLGRKTGIGAGAYSLLEEATFVQPAGDTQMYIESASANDDDGGSGANIITIEYFAAAWGDKKTTTVTMNGTAQEILGVSDIYRIHKMYITKGGNAAGLIKLTNQAKKCQRQIKHT